MSRKIRKGELKRLLQGKPQEHPAKNQQDALGDLLEVQWGMKLEGRHMVARIVDYKAFAGVGQDVVVQVKRQDGLIDTWIWTEIRQHDERRGWWRKPAEE